MYCDYYPFFGVVKTPLIRGGKDFKLEEHTFFCVYAEMLCQIARDYHGLPDIRTLKAHQIRFLFEGLRGELKQYGQKILRGGGV